MCVCVCVCVYNIYIYSVHATSSPAARLPAGPRVPTRTAASAVGETDSVGWRTRGAPLGVLVLAMLANCLLTGSGGWRRSGVAPGVLVLAMLDMLSLACGTALVA